MSGPPAFPSPRNWRLLLELALAEDLGPGDVTTPLVLAEDAQGRARIEARQRLVVCGLPIAAAVFEAVDPELRFESLRRDGELAEAGEPLAFVSGGLRAILGRRAHRAQLPRAAVRRRQRHPPLRRRRRGHRRAHRRHPQDASGLARARQVRDRRGRRAATTAPASTTASCSRTTTSRSRAASRSP